MLLTAAAVVVGASVILFDLIFEGLAISLMAGEVASLLISQMAVPVPRFCASPTRRCRCSDRQQAVYGAKPNGMLSAICSATRMGYRSTPGISPGRWETVQ
jgi:hypothetical protein